MKHTRIAKLQQSKRGKKVVTSLTVGLFFCPLILGSNNALATTEVLFENALTVKQTIKSSVVNGEVIPVVDGDNVVEVPTIDPPITEPEAQVTPEEAPSTEADAQAEPSETPNQEADTQAPQAETDKSGLELAIINGEAQIAEGGWVDTARLTAAIDIARNVSNDSNATQTQIDTATENINTAADALEKIDFVENAGIDKAALETAIANGDAKSAEYSWLNVTRLTAAIENGRNVSNDSNATQIQVDVAIDGINMAIDALENASGAKTAAEKSRLEEAITNGDAKSLEGGWITITRLTAAIENGRNVSNNINASQAQINVAIDGINTAIDALEKIDGGETVVDKSALETVIANGDVQIAEGGWLTTARLTAAVENGKNVSNDSNASQVQVDVAIDGINTAIDALEKVDGGETVVDKSALETAIANGEAQISEGSQLNVARLTAAIENGKNVFNDSSASQVQVDVATEGINTAIDAG